MRRAHPVAAPTGVFYAQGVKANVLFFDRKPASETPWTRDLWIYDLRTNQRLTLKTNLMTRAHLEDFVSCYRADDRTQRQESEQFRRLTCEELTQRDKANLDIFMLRDESWRTPKICRRPTRYRRGNYRGPAGGAGMAGGDGVGFEGGR